jgi:hypothetical protein
MNGYVLDNAWSSCWTMNLTALFKMKFPFRVSHQNWMEKQKQKPISYLKMKLIEKIALQIIHYWTHCMIQLKQKWIQISHDVTLIKRIQIWRWVYIYWYRVKSDEFISNSFY